MLRLLLSHSTGSGGQRRFSGFISTLREENEDFFLSYEIRLFVAHVQPFLGLRDFSQSQPQITKQMFTCIYTSFYQTCGLFPFLQRLAIRTRRISFVTSSFIITEQHCQNACPRLSYKTFNCDNNATDRRAKRGYAQSLSIIIKVLLCHY